MDGKDLAAPATFATKTEAQQYLSGIEVDQARGTWLDPAKGEVSVRTYADAWLQTRTVKGRPLRPRTQANYRALLDHHILATLGELPMSAMTPQRIRMWHAEVAAVGSTTAAQAYRVLHAILATATVEGTYTRNPCQIRGGSTPDTPKRPLVLREDADALADAMPEQLSVLILLAFWGGLRLGELLGLQFGDLELDRDAGAGSVHIQRQLQEIDNKPVIGPPKADSIRTVHLPEPAVVALIEHVDRAGAVLPRARVFTRISGGELRPWDVQRYWRRARKAAQLPAELATLHIHDLRHGGLTLATQSGASLAEVMRRAGHASSRAAMIYQHAAEDRDATVAARMASVAGTGRTRRPRAAEAEIVELRGRQTS